MWFYVFFKHLMKSTEQPRKIIEHDEQTIDFHKNNNHTHTEKEISFKKIQKKKHIFLTHQLKDLAFWIHQKKHICQS